MKNIKRALCLAATGLMGLVFASNNLQAEDPSSEPPWLMAKYDLNGDATITLEEVSEKKKSLFIQLDHNRDGHISFGEYETIDQAKRQSLLRKRFSKLDEDKNGKVSEAEYASFVGLFSSLDSDGDGALSEMEVHSRNYLAKAATQEPTTYCLLWFCIRDEL